MQFIDLKRQFEHLRPAIESRINDVLEHGKFILGPEMKLQSGDKTEAGRLLNKACGMENKEACSFIEKNKDRL